jgi:hypothetical protein
MAHVYADRVKETSTTTGTGTLNLAGATSGFRTFVSGIGTGNTTVYAIVHQTLAEWEVGVGTVTDAATDTLSRTTILASSNSNNAVSFSAGTKDVFCTMAAARTVLTDASGNAVLGTPASGTLTNCTGLPIASGVSGLGANVATFLAIPSSANLLATLSDETGTGAAVFGTSPTLTTPTIATIKSASATAPPTLANSAGTEYGTTCRAWVNFNGTALSGTYSRTGTTVTVTITSHGLSTGMIANLDFTSGTATDGSYSVTVTGANTFTVTDSASGSTSGNVTMNLYIRAAFNVTSVTDNGSGDYTVNFTNALADEHFAVVAVGALGDAVLPNNSHRGTTPRSPTASSIRLVVTDGSAGADLARISVAAFR